MGHEELSLGCSGVVVLFGDCRSVRSGSLSLVAGDNIWSFSSPSAVDGLCCPILVAHHPSMRELTYKFSIAGSGRQ